LFNMLDEFKPDIILLDIYLKDSDGRYLCNLLKSLGKTENIPIVLISGMMEESEVSERDILADGFLYKPFDLDESIQKIRSLLN
ncbi:MAG: response regulator, partial [Pedobacter sp.]